MKTEYEIDRVVIDVQAGEITILDNNKDIPTQTTTFTDEDYWFSIKDRKGNYVMDGNIWWDEQWGFQYVGFMEQKGKDGKMYTTNDGDYRNPELISFKNNDQTPLYELDWMKGYKTDKYEFRGVMEDGDDSVMSLPLHQINVDEHHEVKYIGLYEKQPDGTQQHVLDISHHQIKQWNGLFMGFRYKKE